MAFAIEAFLRNAGNELSQLLHVLTTLFGFIFEASSFLGRSLVAAIFGITSFVYHAFIEFGTLCTVIIEDFYAFVLDAGQVVESFTGSVCALLVWTNQCIWSVLTSVSSFAHAFEQKLRFLCYVVSYGFAGIFGAISDALTLLRNAIILIGNGSLSFFTKLPRYIIEGVIAICFTVLSLLDSVLRACLWLPIQTGSLFLSCGRSTVSFFMDIPLSSYCGLLVAFTAVYLVWRLRRVWTAPVWSALIAFRGITWQVPHGFITIASLVTHRVLSVMAGLASRIAVLFSSHEGETRDEDDRSDIADVRNAGFPRTSTPLPSSSANSRPKAGNKIGTTLESTLDETVHDSLLRELERERDSRLCIVCQDSLKSVILLPCRHLCLCEACRSAILATYPRACPICRKPVLETMRVYL